MTAKSATKTKPSAAANTEGKEFTISRVIDAPLERVWRAWTDAKQLKNWWGPKGFEIVSTKVDLRPGGVFHYHLRSPDGQDMWGKFIYREIVPQKRLVFVVSFSDEAGGVKRHPLHERWPLTILSTVTFAERGIQDSGGREHHRGVTAGPPGPRLRGSGEDVRHPEQQEPGQEIDEQRPIIVPAKNR